MPSANVRKRVLLVAYHFPPLQGSTGFARSLAFAKYLKDWNWDVTVLTVEASVYPEIREQNYALIPDNIECVRSMAFDAQKHLSIFGKYPLFLATPDRLQSWIVSGVLSALRVIRKNRPDAILTTYPIASAHCIGFFLHKIFRIPWIADFRDPMAQEDYPPEPRIHRAFERIERRIFRNAARVVVTSPGTAALYSTRFPDYPQQNIVTISNGFDPESFAGITIRSGASAAPEARRPLKLLHSGLLYPSERDPTHLFAAIAELLSEKRLSNNQVSFVFRASGNDTDYQKRVRRLGIDSVVHFLSAVPYVEAIAEIASADGLLLLQASNCNQQIPAKLYEYLYAGVPILALTDAIGDTGQLLQQLCVKSVADLADKHQIKRALLAFVEDILAARSYVVPIEKVMQYSRRELTGGLAKLLNSIASKGTKRSDGD